MEEEAEKLPLLNIYFILVKEFKIMKLSSKKIVLDNFTKDVISMDEYNRLIKMSVPILDDMCVEDNGYVYPISKQYKPDEVSVYSTNEVTVFTAPVTNEHKEKYSIKNCIDFGSDAIKNLSDHISLAHSHRAQPHHRQESRERDDLHHP